MVDSLEPQPAPGRIGQVVKDTYRLTRLLGKGGMGEVYEAEHVSLPRRFAVKFLLGELGWNSEVLARFHQEASIAASVGSKHIVEVFDYGQSADGGYFMVMEFLEGETLTDRIRSHGAYTPAEWIGLFSQIADGLAAAHGHGVVHRDLKPDNVFLGRDKDGSEVLKILDFGISKIRDTGSGMTQDGAVMGTPSYMAPEQAEGATSTTDARADIFSLGAIVYEALTGKVAFEGPTMPATILKVCYQEPDPLETVAPHLSPAVITVVNRALRKAPADRFQSVREFFDEFCAAAGHATAAAPGAAADNVSLAPTVVGARGTSDTTLSAAAAELAPTALPTPEASSGGGKGMIIAVVIIALAVIGAGLWFFVLRDSGGTSKSGGAAKPAVDAATPASSSNTNNADRTPPPDMRRADPVAPMPVGKTPDASVQPDPRRAAGMDRPRPDPMDPAMRVKPMQTPVMRRRPMRRRPMRRTSMWAE